MNEHLTPRDKVLLLQAHLAALGFAVGYAVARLG